MMKVEVFEKATNINRNLERVITNLKHLENSGDFDRGSIQIFTEDAETLRAGINRYFGERVVKDSNDESVKLNALRQARKPTEEEDEEK